MSDLTSELSVDLNAEGIPYAVHCPTLTNLVIHQFHYFKIYVKQMESIMQEKIGWNKNYPAAQKIYSMNPASRVLRAAIQAQHSVLYSGRKNRNTSHTGRMMGTGQEFLKLLMDYRDPILASEGFELYTYSLVNESLRFSRTSAETGIDFASKHALHASGSEFVYAAGEFWVADGKLYIDNNSGTFAPPGSMLTRLKALLELNFQGLEVICLDCQTQEWKTHRHKI